MVWTRFVDDRFKGEYDEEELLNTLYSEMFIVAYAKMKNKADALDIVQESWIKILNKIDTLRDEEKLVQWAKTIVSNTANNVLRRKSIRQEVFAEELLHNQKTDEDDWETRMLAKELMESMRYLDEDTRKMFLYKFYHGLKDRQIADMMGYPVGTVKARLHRGKERLRGLLKETFREYNA